MSEGGQQIFFNAGKQFRIENHDYISILIEILAKTLAYQNLIDLYFILENYFFHHANTGICNI